MNFNQLQRHAKSLGWTTGYTPAPPAAKALNAAIDAMTDIERSQLQAQLRARRASSEWNFVEGFCDFVQGRLLTHVSDGYAAVFEQLEPQADAPVQVLDLSACTEDEKQVLLKALMMKCAAEGRTVSFE